MTGAPTSKTKKRPLKGPLFHVSTPRPGIAGSTPLIRLDYLLAIVTL